MPNDDPAVRLATAADAPELARLRWESSAEDHTPVESEDAFAERMTAAVRRFLDSGWSVWVAEDPRRPGPLVGCLFLQRIEKAPRPYPRRRTWGYVTNVYVTPAWRNQGIGTRLLGAVIDQARAEDLDLLHLWPSRRAVPLYRRAGFEPSPDALELSLESGR